ncbi:MAG: hypothetical protein PHN49_12280 [Candidatus Omnitrophica bacterium]|nr:hypothetical protein [Candidatus Omnitrophota bacterium]MDD5672403.1 hypothetical protein [Candidatus Omnitrophota bacterium]
MEEITGSSDSKTLKFPKIWPGFVLALLFLLIIIAALTLISGEGQPLSQALNILALSVNLAGFVYWNVCVYRLHQSVLMIAGGSYPISPGKAVGFGFIPVYTLYWRFKWPAEMLTFIQTRSGTKTIPRWLPGLGMLFSGMFLTVLPLIWYLVNFSVLAYLIKELKASLAVQSEHLPYKAKTSLFTIWTIIVLSIIPGIVILGILAAIAIPAFVAHR